MSDSDGVPLKQIAETPGFDPVRTWGPGPLLLIQAASPVGAAPFMFDTPADSGNAASTRQLNPQASGALSAYLAKNAVLAPIRKTKRNAFGPQIMIGRARSNDIRLSDSSISKVHCYVYPPPSWPLFEEGGWRIRDAHSTNGTFVVSGSGEVKVTHETPGFVLQPGTELRLGLVSAIYVDPEHLLQALSFARTEWERLDREQARRGHSDTSALPPDKLPRKKEGDPPGQ